MRKVLLATTALVAMSVTAAQADVSISGNVSFDVLSPSTGDQSFNTDGNIVIKGSTTRRSSFAFGTVVFIVSCNNSDVDILRNIAFLWELFRPNLRPDFLCRIINTL